MSTWRCGWICPRSYLFAAVFWRASRAVRVAIDTTSRNPFWPLRTGSAARSHNTVGAPPATYNVPSV